MGSISSFCFTPESGPTNEIVLYKNQTVYNKNETPTIKDLMHDTNVKNAIVHDTEKTIYVGHDKEGRTNYGMVKHRNSKEASDFINNQVKQLDFNNEKKYLS